MKVKFLVFSFFILVSNFGFTQATDLPEWVNGFTEYIGLSSSQLQNRFTGRNIERLSNGNIQIQEFPTQASGSIFSFNSEGNVNRWLIVFSSGGDAVLANAMFERLINQFTIAYGNPGFLSTDIEKFWMGRVMPASTLMVELDRQRNVVVVVFAR